jgi:hypothetical protein
VVKLQRCVQAGWLGGGSSGGWAVRGSIPAPFTQIQIAVVPDLSGEVSINISNPLYMATPTEVDRTCPHSPDMAWKTKF